MVRTIAALALFTACAFPAVEDDIRAAEKAWAAAVVKKDAAALEKMYDEKLIYAHSTGNIENRKEYLDRLTSGAQRYDTITHETVRVVPYGNSAVAHSVVRMTGNSSGRVFDDRLMMMHVWVKQGNTWRLVAHQTTRLP